MRKTYAYGLYLITSFDIVMGDWGSHVVAHWGHMKNIITYCDTSSWTIIWGWLAVMNLEKWLKGNYYSIRSDYYKSTLFRRSSVVTLFFQVLYCSNLVTVIYAPTLHVMDETLWNEVMFVFGYFCLVPRSVSAWGDLSACFHLSKGPTVRDTCTGGDFCQLWGIVKGALGCLFWFRWVFISGTNIGSCWHLLLWGVQYGTVYSFGI